MAIQLNHRQNRITTGSNAETAGVELEIFNTGAIVLPKGTTAQRNIANGVVDATKKGGFRFNTDTNTLEYFNGENWNAILANYVEDLRDANGEMILDGVSVGATTENYVQIANAAAAGTPEIRVAGSDTNIGLNIESKGTGSVTIGTGLGNVATFVSGGPQGFEFRAGSTAAVMRSEGDMNIDADIVRIQNLGNTVAEFISTGAGTDEKLVITAEVSGIALNVFSGSNPGGELHIRQQLDMSGNQIKNVADPSLPQDGATKAYVDAAINGLDWKASVKVATVGGATPTDFSGWSYNNAQDLDAIVDNTVWTVPTPLIIDGYTVQVGDRVLVKNAPDAKGNGIFVLATATTMYRSEDANNLPIPGQEVSEGMAVYVEDGDLNASTQWVLTAPGGDTDIGTSELVFTQFGGAGSLVITGGAGLTSTPNGVNWTIDANVDNTTVYVASGDNLAVKGTDTIGQILRSNGDELTAEWGALDLEEAASIEGVLPFDHGGTGFASHALGTILVGTGTNLTQLPAGTAGQFLKSDGTTVAYASASVNDLDGFAITSASTGDSLVFDGTNWVNQLVSLENGVSGVLPVNHGGTGVTSVPAGNVVIGGTASALANVTLGAASTAQEIRVLSSNDGVTPAFTTVALNNLSDVDVSGAPNGSVLGLTAGVWGPIDVNESDKFVKVNSSDTTSGYLEDKAVAHTSGAMTIAPNGGNSALEFSVNVDETTIDKVGNNLAVKSTGTAGQILRSTGTDTQAAEWGALNLANTDAVTGTLAQGNGGTGFASYTQGDLLVAGEDNALFRLAVGAEGELLRVNGSGNPVWATPSINDLGEFVITGASAGQTLVFNGTNWVNGALDLADDDAVTGLLPVSHGGTGLAALAANTLLVGNGTETMGTLAAGASSTTNLGTVLTVDTLGNVAWGNLTLGQLSNVADTAPATTDVLQWNGTAWVPGALSGLDKLVRVSDDDTTSGYLEGKLGTSDGVIAYSVLNDGGNEVLQLAVNVDTNTIIKVGTTLAVGDDQDQTNKVLFGNTAGAAATWNYVQNLRNTSGVPMLAAGGTATNGNKLTVNASDTETTISSSEDMVIAASGNVTIQGIVYPNTLPARSVLVANSEDTLVALQAAVSGDQLVRWNDTLESFEFIAQGDVGGFAFRTINVTGNGNATGIEADSTSDTMGVVAGAGVAINGDAGADTLTFSMTLENVPLASVEGTDVLTFWDNGTLSQIAVANVIADLDLVTITGASTGMLVQTSDGVFASRTIEVDGAGDKAGLTIVNGDGIAGNPVVGLNVDGLPELSGIADKAADFVVLYDASEDANVKVTVSALVGGIDNTRINDVANTTYVDTDEVAGKVVIASNGGTVAEFEGAAGSAAFFSFDTATSAGVIRMEAAGTDTDINIRLVPKGTGEVFIGDSGNGVIQADDGFNLTLAGGDNGGDLFLKAGLNSGVVTIQANDGDAFVTFGDANVITHYATTATSLTEDHVLRLATTGAASATANIAVATGANVLVEAYIIGRPATFAANVEAVAYKVKAVGYENSGLTLLGDVVQEVIAEATNLTDATATITASGSNIVISVTGDADANLNWTAFVKVVSVA